MTEQENIHAHIAEEYNGLKLAREQHDGVAEIFHEVNVNVWLEALSTYMGGRLVERAVA